ncbi:MAG: hypothetical protein ABSC06_28810 [Rhodopila sp.]|jgi:hypothetical protein
MTVSHDALRRLMAERKQVPSVPTILERPEIIFPARPTADPVLTEGEVRAMVEMAVKPLQRQLDDQHSINRRLLAMTEDLSIQMRHLRNEVREQPSATSPKPIDLRQTLPPVADITRLEVQLFNNLAAKAKQKALGKSGRGTANFKLKLNVWTCVKSEIRKHREGTCGSFYMTMLAPGSRALRNQLGTALDYLNADDAKFIGCLGGSSKFSKKRVFEQAAIIMPDNRLFLQIGDQRIDCGLPQIAPNDFAEGAHVLRWHWPDIIG